MNDSEKLIKLKELLLNEDRVFAQDILNRLDDLEHLIETQNKLSGKVNPIIDDKLKIFVAEIPDKLGPVIADALTKSQDKVVDALFPVIGKMIKKYIQQEISILSEKINNQVSNTFSVKKWKRKIQGKFTGFTEEEIIMSELAKPKILQLFVIESGSGIVIANASNTETIDQDMIAGMLTAIKSFVEDAIVGNKQSLESIEYELYEIYLKNFHSYYIAVVLSGNINDSYKSELENDLLEFATKHLNSDLTEKDLITEKLTDFIKNE